MHLWHSLKIRPGITALIGSGGKTTLLYALGEELRQQGRVLLCTTTRIWPPQAVPWSDCSRPDAIQSALAKEGLLCLGTPRPDGKLGPPELSMDVLASLADFVFVEADGAAGLPLKAHLPHEPVLPQHLNQVIAVVGLLGFGLPIAQAAHRAARFAAISGAQIQDPATPERVAQVLRTEALHTRVFFNQADLPDRAPLAMALAPLLGCPAILGSLQKGWSTCLC